MPARSAGRCILRPFDPYPNILADPGVSSVALQAPVITMRQNRRKREPARTTHDDQVHLRTGERLVEAQEFPT